MAGWIKGRQGEELSEVLRNTPEPDGHNNGNADVDDNGGAHAFLQSMEDARHGTKPKLKSLKERLSETEAKAQALRKKLKG